VADTTPIMKTKQFDWHAEPHPSDNSGHVHIPEHAECAAVLAVSMWCELPI
jgi:hypothetical protein